MKKIFNISAVLLAAVTLASCNLNKTPVFTEDMSFAAFDKLSISVAESGEQVLIPITIASIDPVKVAVAYSVVEGGTAVEGTNFKLKDDSGVLSFDGKVRTAYIPVEIIDQPGKFTGDIKFSIEIVSAGSLQVGANSVCTVTITDNDHPLANILGTYTFSDPVRGTSWTGEIRKDPEDVTMCWFTNPCNISSSWVGDDIVYYGRVDIEAGTIAVPLGQESEYKYSGTTPVTLCLIDNGLNFYWTEGDDYIITITDGGAKLEYPSDYGLMAYIIGAGQIGNCRGGTTAVKN